MYEILVELQRQVQNDFTAVRQGPYSPVYTDMRTGVTRDTQGQSVVAPPLTSTDLAIIEAIRDGTYGTVTEPTTETTSADTFLESPEDQGFWGAPREEGFLIGTVDPTEPAGGGGVKDDGGVFEGVASPVDRFGFVPSTVSGESSEGLRVETQSNSRRLLYGALVLLLVYILLQD